MTKKVKTEWISVDGGKGQTYDAYLALPPAGTGPGHGHALRQRP